MKVIYTKSAELELQRFYSTRKSQLEEIVKRNKYVLGDDVIEITASDIKNAEKYFYVADNNSKRPYTNLLLKIYAVLGVFMIIGGLFYQDLKTLIEADPVQQMLVLGGIALSLTSLFASYFLRVKRQKHEMHRNKYDNLEKRFLNED